MPRTNSRKRNNYRNVNNIRGNENTNRANENTSRGNANSNRVSVASTLSPNAPEFVPLTLTNDETASIQKAIVPVMLNGTSTSASNSNETNSNSDNSKSTVKTSSKPNPLENVGQRDLLINLLNSSKVDCVICYETTKNIDPIWNCRNCFQIMHLKCIMVWFLKSHNDNAWRCPACQNQVVGKPTYFCFCGTLPNPYSNNVDIPHSCGQVCGLIKKNSNAQYDCHHKCTLLCHPGPCPQCVVQVSRKCGCGKTQRYAHCGQSDPIVCENICSKELSCKNHVCEKQCHANPCDPCNKNCPQTIIPPRRMVPMEYHIVSSNWPIIDRLFNNRHRNVASDDVTEEELQLLGINPEDISNSIEDRNDDEDLVVNENEDGYDYDYDYDSDGNESISDVGIDGLDGIFDDNDEYDDDYVYMSDRDHDSDYDWTHEIITRSMPPEDNSNLRLIEMLANAYESNSSSENASESTYHSNMTLGSHGSNYSVGEGGSNSGQTSSGSEMEVSSSDGSDFAHHSWSSSSISTAQESSPSSLSESTDSSIATLSSISSVANSLSSFSTSDTSSSSF